MRDILRGLPLSLGCAAAVLIFIWIESLLMDRFGPGKVLLGILLIGILGIAKIVGSGMRAGGQSGE